METDSEGPDLTSQERFNSLLAQWESERGTATSPVPILKGMAEVIEKETENFLKLDPDPFDDRHPARVYPDCALGELFTALFKDDDFMHTLVNNYIMATRERELQEAALRLLLDVVPGLETSIIFQETDGLLNKFLDWAENADEPLRSYATGLLATAMEVQDIADTHREANMRLVPVMMQRLHNLKQEASEDTPSTSSPVDIDQNDEVHHFKRFRNKDENDRDNDSVDESSQKDKTAAITSDVKTENVADMESHEEPSTEAKISFASIPKNVSRTKQSTPISKLSKKSDSEKSRTKRHGAASKHSKEKSSMGKGKQSAKLKAKTSSKSHSESTTNMDIDPDCSNSSWVELSQFIIGSHSIYPITKSVQQRFILEYLTPLGEYQELLGTMFENGAMELVHHYIDMKKTRDVRLTLTGLRYLASLLCHKKFAVEFVELKGVQKLLEIQRPSLASTGVSICMYYLAYNEDTMERICLQPQKVLRNLIDYALWLLECSHESGRCHATMFFMMSIQFGAVLSLFDKQDGMRKLFNTISTLSLLNHDTNPDDINEDEMFTSRQTIKHTCMALKRYFETHLTLKVDSIKKAWARTQGLTSPDPIPPYKPLPVGPERTVENMETMLEHAPGQAHWEPVRNFIKLQGVQLLLKAVAIAYEWKNYSGRGDTIRAALDVLGVITVTTKGQLQMCEPVRIPQANSVVSMNIVNFIAAGQHFSDPDAQRSALQVIINCVCGPSARHGVCIRRLLNGPSTLQMKFAGKQNSETIEKLWDCVRNDNGIKTLLLLLMVKTPITEADSIRALACQALCGLSRSESVQQILSKLPLFANNQLQGLMKEPVLHEKRNEHLKFCQYASELIERVTGKPMSLSADATVAKLHKANIVAQTRITYSQKELLQLIHQHLLEQGLSETAGVLQREADLPKPVTTISSGPLTPPQPTLQMKTCITPKMSPQIPPPTHSSNNDTEVAMSSPSQTSSHHGTHNTQHTPIPDKIVFGPESRASPSGANKISQMLSSQQPMIRKRVIREKISHSQTFLTNLSTPKQRVPQTGTKPPPTLDSIVSQYLREQHAQCSDPVVACPEFCLSEPHRCPEPKFRRNAPINAASRMLKRSINPRYGGVDGARCTRHFVYSRFRPAQTFRELEEDSCFTCAAFTKHTNFKDTLLLVGAFSGELKLYNMFTGVEENSYSCHDSPMKSVEPSQDGQLVLTSSYWSDPAAALWSLSEDFEKKYTFGEDEYVEFGKLSEDRIIGTKKEVAHIYDAITGKCISTLQDIDMSNHYNRNCATFNSTDELVLNDGVLWDVRCTRPIYKFDQFQNNISGIFHPLGLEIIISSEIWDIRTFHLLQTVPDLDQCKIVFNSNATVMYGVKFEAEDEELTDGTKCPFGSSFRTFDATDYKPIATIDVKKNIYDLATDPMDMYLAVLEHQGNQEDFSGESVCHLYEVGRPKKADGEEDEDDPDEDDLMGDDDDDHSDESLDGLLGSDSDEENDDDENNGSDGDAADNQESNSNSADEDDDSDDDDDDDDDGDISVLSLSLSGSSDDDMLSEEL
ncbi:DDB1- and CUL4-associated factor 1 [Holothuria leucospilota]|uniref:DDB1- and CUL4-associated factor 1 n=1 Tax=Holothuria leucospilota TaxID=206669 RepID=A0A9Q1CLS1_HOLLE|nr:DDB1- and CUL4-associated factor 1 [Holothuria leucospilota]